MKLYPEANLRARIGISKGGRLVLLDLERVQARMAERNLDALIGTCAENVIWAADYTNWMIDTFKDQEVYALVPRQGELALVVPIEAADFLAERPAAVARLYTYGSYFIVHDLRKGLRDEEARLLRIREESSHHPTALDALTQALRDQALLGGTIGVDERGVSPERWQSLADALSTTRLQSVSRLFRELRRIKTAPEVERLRQTLCTVEDGLEAAFRLAAPGVTEAELERAYRATVAATGAQPGHFEASAGTRSGASFPASAVYRIQSGDVIRADVGGRYRGYWADTGRTRAVGKAPEGMVRYYDALQAGISAILARVRAGVPVGDLFDAGVQTVREQGIPHYQRHHVGHGIGLEMYEEPILSPVDSGASGPRMRLEAGMVINVELPYYELGLGGLQIEETLVVRADGYDLLTTASRDLWRGNP
jgi:Xaa-Pro dipeptidase